MARSLVAETCSPSSGVEHLWMCGWGPAGNLESLRYRHCQDLAMLPCSSRTSGPFIPMLRTVLFGVLRGVAWCILLKCGAAARAAYVVQGHA